jgi:hypothetical protein
VVYESTLVLSEGAFEAQGSSKPASLADGAGCSPRIVARQRLARRISSSIRLGDATSPNFALMASARVKSKLAPA